MLDVAVDIGNMRIKWGRCSAQEIVETVSLSDSVNEWKQTIEVWFPAKKPLHWAIGSVHPNRRDRFAEWLRQRGDTCSLIESDQSLPIRVEVDFPSRVGIDRILNAIGASKFQPQQHTIIVDAGTALTVDAVDAKGTFLGGYILPGLTLLARSLHEQTAKLPRIENFDLPARIPGKNTEEAIRSGLVHLLIGGIERLETLLTKEVFMNEEVTRLITGGDARFLQKHLGPERWIHAPTLTLEGIRLAALAGR